MEIARRGTVVAVVGPPPGPAGPGQTLRADLRAWRDEWSVGSWPDDDVFDGLRDRSSGRDAPW